MTHLFHIVGICAAAFLIGVNVAFIAHLGMRLVRWFLFKVLAVTALLVYVTLSFWLGDPTLWRTVIGLIAILIDLIAICWMWYSIERFAKLGISGIVPLLRVRQSDLK